MTLPQELLRWRDEDHFHSIKFGVSCKVPLLTFRRILAKSYSNSHKFWHVAVVEDQVHAISPVCRNTPVSIRQAYSLRLWLRHLGYDPTFRAYIKDTLPAPEHERDFDAVVDLVVSRYELVLPTIRKCLCCGVAFLSDGVHNRMCDECR